MPGLVPGTHAVVRNSDEGKKNRPCPAMVQRLHGVGARDKRGHDVAEGQADCLSSTADCLLF